MDVSASRKQTFDTDEMAAITSEQNKNKATDDAHDLGLIPKDAAWQFGISDLLDSPTTIPTANPGQLDGNNFKKYDHAKSLFLLCVIGETTLQLDVLCPIYSTILGISPNLQALVLTHDPKALNSIFSIASISLPIVEAQGNPASHFLKLGLLHPLGGGRQPLDAIVVIDTQGRRRLVLPFGWGAGRQVGDPMMGFLIQQQFSELLKTAIQDLETERTKGFKDFYDIAKTYF